MLFYNPKMRVKKTLVGIKRSLMCLAETLHKFKIRSKHVLHFLRIVAVNSESAAFFRSVFGESRNDKMRFGF